MPQSINSMSAELTRFLIAIWCFSGNPWLGGGAAAATCCLLLESGPPDELLLESGGSDCLMLEDC